MKKRKHNFGITLVEMLVTSCIVAVLLSIAGPSFAQMLSGLRLKNQVDAFFASVLLARSEAAKSNARTVMCKTTNGQSCVTDGGWDQGWIVFHDLNNNAELDGGESVVWHQQALDSAIKISGNTPVAKYISYTPTGTTNLVSGAFQAGTVKFCHGAPKTSETWQIVINKTGRPKSLKATANLCS
jgi:type IV fimbrial biogenesis protein FimT